MRVLWRLEEKTLKDMTASSIRKARTLRVLFTDAEQLLWQKIRSRQLGHKIRRQMPVGPYTVDFVCLELKLVMEIDGGQHAESKKDEIRTVFLNSLGFKVVRFWNNDVVSNIDGVLSTLTLTLSQRERELGNGKGFSA